MSGIKTIEIDSSIDNEQIIVDIVKSVPLPKAIQSKLINSKNGVPRRIIYGYMTTPLKDAQGEVLNPKGMDGRYFGVKGWIKYEHKAEAGNLKGAEQLLGTPLAYRITPKGNLYIAELFSEIDNKPIVDELWNTLVAIDRNPNMPKMGVSAEGRYEERDGDYVNKWLVINLVVTPNPVNIESEVNILKSMNVDRDGIEKTLTATPISTNFADKVGGDAIATENVYGNEHKKVNAKRRHQMKKGKEAKNRKELEDILRQNPDHDEDFIKKCVKAMGFEDDEEEKVDRKDEAEEMDEGEDEKEDKKKSEKSLTAGDLNKAFEGFNAGIDRLAKSLVDNMQSDIETDTEVFSDSDVDFDDEIETPEDTSAMSDAILEVARYSNANTELTKSLIQSQMTVMKGDQIVMRHIDKLEKSMSDMQATLNLLAKAPDGFASAVFHTPEDKTQTATDKTFLVKSQAANLALNKGKITGGEYADYMYAIGDKSNKTGNADLIKSIEELINSRG